jgi:hypothetical protein
VTGAGCNIHKRIVTCPPKTDPVVKLELRYIIGLRKGENTCHKRNTSLKT